MQVSREFKGIFLASISATFWGISGAVAQTLFDTTDINSIWLTGIRMLGAGIALLLVSLLTHVDLWSIWRQPRDLLQIDRGLHTIGSNAGSVHLLFSS
nr:EamA family transporter [Lactiplantibacillus plantarum]